MSGAAAWFTTAEVRGARRRLPRGCAVLAALWLAAAPCAAAECSPHVEEQHSPGAATFRPHTSVFEPCPVDEATYRNVVSNWLRRRPADAQALASLSLGRAVSFPWISRHMADAALADPRWNARTGNPRGTGINNLVAELLEEPALLARLGAPFEGSGYAVAGVSVEKVLVGKAGEFSSSASPGKLRVPFDAQVWLRLSRR